MLSELSICEVLAPLLESLRLLNKLQLAGLNNLRDVHDDWGLLDLLLDELLVHLVLHGDGMGWILTL